MAPSLTGPQNNPVISLARMLSLSAVGEQFSARLRDPPCFGYAAVAEIARVGLDKAVRLQLTHGANAAWRAPIAAI